MIRVAAALTLAFSPAALAAQSAAPTDVVAGARACLAATGPDGIVDDAFAAEGWERAAASADGRAIDTPLRFYGRPGTPVMLIASPGARPSCTVVARVAKPGDRDGVLAALRTALGATLASGATLIWRTDTHMMAYDATGTDAAPAVRIAVINRPREAE